MVASRGITHRYRHLMNDWNALMPHSKKEGKLDSKNHLEDLNELCELNNCNNCLYFEVRKHTDMYLWVSKTPSGPSAKFHVKNVHTMDELKMVGNCLKGSRPILSFDAGFESEPYLQLLKELFTQTFAVPKSSRKLKPFLDHVMSFSVLDGKIWIRNYQILEKSPVNKETSLVEIGPRVVLDVMRIFDGSFGGSTLYRNESFVSPNDIRRLAKEKMQQKYQSRVQKEQDKKHKIELHQLEKDPLNEVF
ncbi:Brix domain-containing protein [Gorgonomyces haynaldii]|nr:Brix domain-containing protein [Gorgonomyces haynaldii]